MQKLIFKSGRSLIKSDLDFLLTPQELKAQLLRAKNSTEILSQLPSSVVPRLGKVESRITPQLIQRIEQALNFGQWIALSSRKRTTPISSESLRKMPSVEQAVAQLESIPDRVIKAGFKPVVDEYVLPPVLEHVPVEPSPEHKIVVELAGQWPSNSASLYLEKTGAQSEKLTKPRQDLELSHRSVAVFKGLEVEPKNLYLSIPMNGTPMPLKLLLAEGIEPVEQETEKDEWDNVLVPVRPLVYIDSTKNKEKSADLKGGYLYLFWKNKLWREFKVTEKGYYQDIDVEYYRGSVVNKDAYREAEGFPLPQFWVPYKISGEPQVGANGLALLFSPAQKTIQEIEELESDSSKLNEFAALFDELSVYSDSQTFSTQEHTTSIADSVIASDTTMRLKPWLDTNGVVLKSLKESKTAVPYLDGHNGNGLGMVLQNYKGEAYAYRPYEIELESEVVQGETDHDGFVSFDDVTTEKQVLVTFWPDDDEPDMSHTMLVKIGELKPIDDPAGVQERLSNLGLLVGKIDGDLGPRTEMDLKTLQYEQGFEVTGKFDADTKDWLQSNEEFS